MSMSFLRYLEREHERLDARIADLRRRPTPDEIEIGRLRKARRLVRDQITSWRAEAADIAA